MESNQHSPRRFAALSIALTLALASLGAAGAGLIGSDTNGTLYDVNPSTGVVSNPRSTGVPYLSGIAYSANGTLYGLSISLDQMSNPIGSLYTINPTTGASVLVGPLGLTSIYEGDLAFDPSSGVLYGVQDDINFNLYLFSMNPSTGAGTDIGIVTAVSNCGAVACDLSAMAFDSTGKLYILDTGGSTLLTVNKSTGAVISSVGLSASGLGIVAGLSINPASGTAYVATGNGTNSFYTLNLSTGAMTLIGPLTGASTGLSGLAFPPVSSPTLTITKSHAGDFTQGQSNAQYTVTVGNLGASTTGTITVTDNVPSGLTLVSMSGSGWNCSSNVCTRSDVLSTGLSFPSITVTVNAASNAPAQVTNQVTASGGGSATASASDLTKVNAPACSYSFSNSPANVGSGTSTGSAALVTSLTNCPYTSVVSNNPDWISIISGLTGTGSGAIGYSVIAANNSGGARTGSFTVFNLVSNVNLAVATFTINQAAASCSSLAASPNQFTFGPAGGSGTVNFNTSPCAWTITGTPSWIILSASTGTGSSFSFTVQAGAARQATLSINGGPLTVSIKQTGLVCTYNIADSQAGFGVSRSFTPSGGGGGISIKAPAGCAWTAAANKPFITIGGSAGGSGNGNVGYGVASNSGSASATGTITIAGLVYVINEQGAGAPSYTCSASSLAASLIRPEGFSEKVSDVVFTCSGQAAPPGGITGDIQLSLDATITNRLLNTGQTDVLLLEDEPTAASLALGTNAFRGVLSSANGASTILFPGVQLATVNGGTFLHTWRITNARVNAQDLESGSTVHATVSITATAPFTVNGQPTVASVSAASTFSVPASSAGQPGQTIQPVSFGEGFASAFGPRVLAAQDPSQAGTVYNSESGYVNTAKLGTQTGFGTSGTRLITAISNVPNGVSVYAPAGPASGTNAEIASADATGAGGFPVPGTTVFNGISYRQVILTGGAGTATWEVTASDPTKIETPTFNLLLLNPNNVSLGAIAYAGALAPVSAGAAPQLPSTTLPVPRFASSTISVGTPSTVTLSVLPQAVVAQGQSQGAALKASLRSEATPSNSVVGGTVTWTQVQTNTGSNSSPTAPNVSVGGTLPTTWVITNCVAADSGGVCPTIDPNNPSNSYTVTYPSLSPGQTGTITLTAQSSSQTSGAVEYTSTIDSDLSNSDPTADSFTTNFPVAEIGLNVTLTHATNFSQGQTGAQYNVVVANGGSIPTSLPVTVTETLPASLTLVSMAGMGWTCTLSTFSCTRSDALPANAPFPAITVTVNVASNAPGSVTNTVVAATGVLQATGTDVTNINAVASVTNVTSSTSNGTYGAGSSISIQVTFSGPVTVTGTPQLSLNSGGTANYSSGSGTATLTFTYTVGGSDSSADLDYASTSALKLNGGTINANLTLPAPGAAGSLGANKNIVIGTGGPPAAFFAGEASLGSNAYYLQFPNGNLFGYYSLQFFPIIYHFDLGFEAFVDGGNGSAYLYDFTSSHWFFTSPSLFPYLYDFTLSSWLYYFPDTKNPGHYTTNPRSFSNLTTGKVITM